MTAKKRETNAGGLRLSTIIERSNIRSHEASAVMAAHNLKATDRMPPDRFLQLLADWRRSPVRGR